MRITALAGGIGGARFLLGLKHYLSTSAPAADAATDSLSDAAAAADADADADAEVTVIGNTGDDIWIHGLRVCPDLDTVMYTLGGGIDTERGWGRQDETFHAKAELAAYGVEPTWFGLGDRDIGTHLVRTASLNAGYRLSDVTAALCERWQPGVRLLPMSDERIETHVLVDDPQNPGTEIAMHFQEWWIRHRAALPARGFAMIGQDNATPAPGVLEAIAQADVIVLPPSNPIVSIGTILGVPGIREAILAANAPVVGVSPIISGAPVRGMADACLSAEGVETTTAAVAAHYGPRSAGGILDAWLVDESDAASVPGIDASGIACRAVPLFMTDIDATAAMGKEALDLAARTSHAG